MEKLITGILGGEFQRHFWPGLFFNILIAFALFLNNKLPAFQEFQLLTIVVVAIPLAVLTGVLLDYLGHIFVFVTVARAAALEKQKITPIVIELAKKKLQKICDANIDYDINLISEFCFTLTRAVSDNAAAQKKYEEQFTYYEFNRSLTLFFIPLLLYIGFISFFKLSGWYTNAVSITGIIFYAIIQLIILLLSWKVFHYKKDNSWAYKLGRWYFASVFSVYGIVSTIQIGILLDYFIKSEIKGKLETEVVKDD